MSGLPYQGGLNSYMFDTSQYGVNSPQSDPNATAGNLASLIPFIGPMIGALGNIASTAAQNSTQERFFSDYMSPQARMAQMRAAGINPNAAAQGISGSSASQMNAASPTGVFSALGEQLGSSVNNALTAENIAAQTRNLEVQSEGQDIQNKINEVELGMKPSLLSAELDDLRESANQKRQQVKQSEEEVKKINEEIENLKEQREYIIAQIGLVEYEERLKEAETRAANAKASLDNASKELTDVEKEIQEKERDNYLTPEEKINKTAEANAKAPVENTPQGQLKQMYFDEMNKIIAEHDKNIARLKQQMSKVPYNSATYRDCRAGIESEEKAKARTVRKYRNKIRRVDKGLSLGGSVLGTGANIGG